MATKLWTSEALVAGTMVSGAITSVGDIVIDIELSEPAPIAEGILVKVKAKEGDNNYKDVVDTNDDSILWLIRGIKGIRKNLVGVNAENVVIELVNPNDVSGEITVEYTKTENPNS
jgi:hypothetical protein